MSNRTARRLLVAFFAVALAGFAAASPAAADHGEGHNGETLELSKSEGLADGEVVTVTLTSWLPGNTATVVTCYIFPAAGPGDCELSNYGEYSTVIADDGTGTVEYPVSIIAGRCDETTPCFVVAGDGFVGANFAAQQFTFAAGAAPEPAPEPEPEPEPAPRARARPRTRTRAHARTRTRAHARTRARTRTGAHPNQPDPPRTRAHARTSTRAHARTRARTQNQNPSPRQNPSPHQNPSRRPRQPPPPTTTAAARRRPG